MGYKHATMQQKLHIVEHLRNTLVQTEEVLSNGKHLWAYRDGVTDGKIAREIGVSRSSVSCIRLDLYGPIIRPAGDPNAVKAYPTKRAELSQMFNDNKALLRQHEQDIGVLNGALKRVQDRLDFLARELGVVWPTRPEV